MASTNPANLDVQSQLNDTDKVMVTDSSGITRSVLGFTLKEYSGTASADDAPAAASVKEVVVTNFTGTALPDQFVINVNFNKGNTYGDTTLTTPTYPKIKFKNSSGTYIECKDDEGNTFTEFDLCDSRGHYAGTGCYNDLDLMTLKRVGKKLLITNSDVRQAVTNASSGYSILSDGTIVYPSSRIDNTFVKAFKITDTSKGASLANVRTLVQQHIASINDGQEVLLALYGGQTAMCIVSKVNNSYFAIFGTSYYIGLFQSKYTNGTWS